MNDEFDNAIADKAILFKLERDEQIWLMEKDGQMDPACSMCQREYYSRTDTMPYNVFAPRHKASSRCQSGKRSHCTCDTCF